MQTQHHSTSMRHAFIKAASKYLGPVFYGAKPTATGRAVLNGIEKQQGTRSKAMWAPLNPVAYNPSCLAVKEARV